MTQDDNAQYVVDIDELKKAFDEKASVERSMAFECAQTGDFSNALECWHRAALYDELAEELEDILDLEVCEETDSS